MNIYNVIILDESGSMSSIYKPTLLSMNEVLGGIRKEQQDHPEQRNFVTIVTFEGEGMRGVKTRRDRGSIEAVADFKESDYQPGGCTPLYDAIGKTLHKLEPQIGKKDRVLVTVITDGYENSSREYNVMIVKSLIDRLRQKGWTFAYIGANQDAVEVARNLHIDNSLNFDATPEGMAYMTDRYSRARRVSSKLWKEQEDSGVHMCMCRIFDIEEDEKKH